jgi:hypothetical protein
VASEGYLAVIAIVASTMQTEKHSRLSKSVRRLATSIVRLLLCPYSAVAVNPLPILLVN